MSAAKHLCSRVWSYSQSHSTTTFDNPLFLTKEIIIKIRLELPNTKQKFLPKSLQINLQKIKKARLKITTCFNPPPTNHNPAIPLTTKPRSNSTFIVTAIPRPPLPLYTLSPHPLSPFSSLHLAFPILRICCVANCNCIESVNFLRRIAT